MVVELEVFENNGNNLWFCNDMEIVNSIFNLKFVISSLEIFFVG